jgi:hypothetical protein
LKWLGSSEEWLKTKIMQSTVTRFNKVRLVQIHETHVVLCLAPKIISNEQTPEKLEILFGIATTYDAHKMLVKNDHRL